MQLTKTQVILVSYKELSRLSGTGWKRRIIEVRVEGLDEEQNKVNLDTASLALTRLIHLTPQAIGEFFSVIWDGDKENPSLIFDAVWPLPEAVVRLDVWGI